MAGATIGDKKTVFGMEVPSWSQMTERERRLALAMAVVLPVLLLVLVIYLFTGSVGELEGETQRYRQMLGDLGVYAPLLAEAEAGGADEGHIRAKFSEEAIADNNVKLTSMFASHAKAVDLNVSSYDESEIPLGGSRSAKGSGPLYVEKQLRVDIRDAKFDKLLELLDRLERSDELLVIKRISLRERRKKDGHVRALVTVSTFTKKERQE